MEYPYRIYWTYVIIFNNQFQHCSPLSHFKLWEYNTWYWYFSSWLLGFYIVFFSNFTKGTPQDVIQNWFHHPPDRSGLFLLKGIVYKNITYLDAYLGQLKSTPCAHKQSNKLALIFFFLYHRGCALFVQLSPIALISGMRLTDSEWNSSWLKRFWRQFCLKMLEAIA